MIVGCIVQHLLGNIIICHGNPVLNQRVKWIMAYIFWRRTAPVKRCGIFNQSILNELSRCPRPIFLKKVPKIVGYPRLVQLTLSRGRRYQVLIMKQWSSKCKLRLPKKMKHRLFVQLEEIHTSLRGNLKTPSASPCDASNPNKLLRCLRWVLET